jgi:hypothetical protein
MPCVLLLFVVPEQLHPDFISDERIHALFSSFKHVDLNHLGPQMLSAYNRYYHGSKYLSDHAPSAEGAAPAEEGDFEGSPWILYSLSLFSMMGCLLAVATFWCVDRPPRPGKRAVGFGAEGGGGGITHVSSSYAATRIAYNCVAMFAVTVGAAASIYYLLRAPGAAVNLVPQPLSGPHLPRAVLSSHL